MFLMAGCAAPSHAPSEAPTDHSEISPSDPIPLPPISYPLFTGAYLAGEEAHWELNETGDLAAQFVITAPMGTPCEVQFAVNFLLESDHGGYLIIEGSSGAANLHSNAGPVQAGPIEHAQDPAGNTHAARITIGGESWGTTPYTFAAENMRWWSNEVVLNQTFSATARCASAFSVDEFRTSRTATVFSDGDFRGGVNLGYAGDAAAAETLTFDALGSDPVLVGHPFGVVGAVEMIGYHAQGDFVWRTVAQDDERLLEVAIPPGPLQLDLHASVDTIGFALADLPLCDPTCQQGVGASRRPTGD